MVIDPRRTRLAERADLWLQIKPGTDPALALGFIHVVINDLLYDRDFVDGFTYGFEDLAEHVQSYSPEKVAGITGIPADLIREGAHLYARSKPAALQWGNAIEHDINVFDSARAWYVLWLSPETSGSRGNINRRSPIMGLGAFVRADLIPDKAKTMIGAYHGTIPA